VRIVVRYHLQPVVVEKLAGCPAIRRVPLGKSLIKSRTRHGLRGLLNGKYP